MEISGLAGGAEYAWTVLSVDDERSLEAVADGSFRGPEARLPVRLTPPCVAVVRIERR